MLLHDSVSSIRHYFFNAHQPVPMTDLSARPAPKTLLLSLFVIFTPLISVGQVGELLWEENFNSLDNWIIDTGNGSWGWGNGELQYYSADNVSISPIENEEGNNALKIVAKRESGADITDQWGNPLNFTSGKINSKSKVSLQFGMVETRIQVPDLETGGWPAFWLLGTTNAGWPSKGELDMMEMGFKQESRNSRDQNDATENNMVGANALFYAESAIVPGNGSGAASLAYDQEYATPYINTENPLNDRFLTYRMYWDNTSVRFTVTDDSVEYDLFADPYMIDEESEEFLEPFYFLINLAIGGTLTDAHQLGDPGSGEAVSMDFPAEMYVDYIRVYEWNEQGTVTLGPPAAKTETYGLFTDSTETNESLFLNDPANIYVWEGTLTDGSIRPFEGDEVITWQTAGTGWFGAGIQSVQPINLSGFSDGNLKFHIKMPAHVAFQIGIIDAWGNQHYVDFPAHQTTYGLERDGEWGQASIPVTDLRGEFIDMRMLDYEFVILEVNGANAEFAIDNIYYDNGIISSAEDHNVHTAPSDFNLLQNYPNPFNPVTTIRYELATSGTVELSIYNLKGQKVATLINSSQSAGKHIAHWHAAGQSSGVYFYRLTTENGYSETKTMVLIK